jgi:hypothetical protein
MTFGYVAARHIGSTNDHDDTPSDSKLDTYRR